MKYIIINSLIFQASSQKKSIYQIIQNDIEEDAYDMNDIADDDDYESEDEY